MQAHRWRERRGRHILDDPSLINRTMHSLSKRRSRLAVGSFWFTVLTPALLFAYAGYGRRWAGDDGFINLRVVSQLLRG